MGVPFQIGEPLINLNIRFNSLWECILIIVLELNKTVEICNGDRQEIGRRSAMAIALNFKTIGIWKPGCRAERNLLWIDLLFSLASLSAFRIQYFASPETISQYLPKFYLILAKIINTDCIMT